MKYINLKSTGNRKCPSRYSSWLDYYMQSNGLRVTPSCGHKGCSKTADVGAHVKKENSVDNKWYIIPSCQACNKVSTSFEINSNVNPVHVR